MDSTLSTQYQKIATGTGLVFIGTFLGTILGFVFRVMIVRYILPADFGLLSLAIVILSVLEIISSLGLNTSVPRYISYHYGKKEYSRIWATIRTSFQLVLYVSIISSMAIFTLAPSVASIFNKMDLITPIRILVFSLPVIVLNNLLLAVLRGFEDVRAKIYFQDIFPLVIRVVVLSVVIILELSFRGVLYAYISSSFILVFFLVLRTKQRIDTIIPKASRSSIPIARELILFSLPLLGSNISTLLLGWTDTLMLGYFTSADLVGCYNIALSFSVSLAIPLSALTFIYLPIVSYLYAQKKINDIQRIYSSVTKWVFCITLPLFLIILLAPKFILRLFFGEEYIVASVALQLLALGKFVHVILGPNGMTLISLGKTNMMLWSTLMSALSNIALNFLLIPKYGIVGAAIASAGSLLCANMFISIFIFRLSTIHPFTRNYLKTIGSTLIISLSISGMNKLTPNVHIFLLVSVISVLSLAAIFFTRSIDKEDIAILESIERRVFKQIRLSNKLAGWLRIQ